MSEIKDGGAAFPRGEIHDDFPRPGVIACRHLHAEEGMTLRDYFAAKALNGLIVSRAGPMGCQHWHDWAKQSYMFADAMILARGAA